MHDISDTIAAVSTPAGEGGIGIIRLSGPEAIAIAARLFRRPDGRPLATDSGARQCYGHIIDPDTRLAVDEVLLSVMHAPHSYTREDVVEISGHGGPVPVRSMLTLVCAQGARLAQPGEFTQRAFLNGRIDLTQAEAVLDTIRARTDAGLRAAQRHLHGEIASRVENLRTALISLLASVEAAIDYAEEDLVLLQPQEIAQEIDRISQDIKQLIASHQQGKLLREGALAVIIGRPNTGKSSLLNALLGQARAIVTDIPGTTRDVIEEQFDLQGIPLRLVDTAGIRPTFDEVERAGVERSRSALELADVILLVLDASQPLTPEDRDLLPALQGRQAIVVLNKADLPPCEETLNLQIAAPLVAVSAKTGDGLPQFLQAIGQLLLDGSLVAESPALANQRQREAAERAAVALDHARQTLEDGGSEELLAVDLMTAASALGEITGDDVREEVINDLFARFCIGK